MNLKLPGFRYSYVNAAWFCMLKRDFHGSSIITRAVQIFFSSVTLYVDGDYRQFFMSDLRWFSCYESCSGNFFVPLLLRRGSLSSLLLPREDFHRFLE